MFRAVLFFLASFVAATAAVPGAVDQHWDIQYRYRQIDSSLSINDIAFPTAMRGIVCGVTTDRHDKDHPFMLLTNDGGQHWTETPVKEAGLSLFFLDDSTGWMVTEKGMWQTVESGRSWTKLKAPAGLLRVWFLDRRHGFAAGLEKRAIETKDGGETWTPLPIAAEVKTDPTFTTFGDLAFNGNHGIISGWNIPPRRGGPDWMEPERAGSRSRQLPGYSVMLETQDAGKSWVKSEASVFGQATRISLASQGIGLGLLEFKDEFEYPSEVYRVNTHTGDSIRSFRAKDRAITDVRVFDGSNRAYIAGYETSGKIYHSPIPGKLKILTSNDLENWEEMTVDYRAVAHRALIAGPDERNVWVATDTGTILKLVTP
jgi:hypothetical protein